MAKWSLEEELVVLYYASREIRYRTVVEILRHKCNSARTEGSLTTRIYKLKEEVKGAGLGQIKDTTIRSEPDWDRVVIDAWLVSKMERIELEKLIEVDGPTAAIIEQDHNMDGFMEKMALNV